MSAPSGTGTSAPARIAVLLSGRGSNYRALQNAVDSGEIPGRIVLVLSNVPGAGGLAHAEASGVEAVAVPHKGEPSRSSHERKVIAELRRVGAEWICLAGYMRLLSPALVAEFPERILNIHPSLLPSFPGLDAQRQAYEYGVRVTGCTVHLVDDGLDSGPIVEQRCLEVAGDDDADSLTARILELEHRAYSSALRRLLTTPWRVDGRRVVFG